MKVTVFNAKKTQGKIPWSPYDDDTFYFEVNQVDSLEEIFTFMVSNYMLNIPLQKNIKARRLKKSLWGNFVEKIDYIVIDIDHVNSASTRALCINVFKEQDFKCILAKSRSDYNIKGLLAVEPMKPHQGKALLKSLKALLPEDVLLDLSSTNYAGYQAPIMKHEVLYQGGEKLAGPVKSKKPEVIKQVSSINTLEQLCINELNKKGFRFVEKTENGYKCSHYSEVKSPNGFTWNPNFPFVVSHWNPARKVSVWDEVVQTPEYKQLQLTESEKRILDVMPDSKGNINARYLSPSVETVDDFMNANLLVLQSPMGTAKSTIIERVIFQARKNNLRILFLTNRISLADDISNKYDEIKHYLGTDLEGNNYTPGDDLVVQIDSLHKFSTKLFDVIIMDEAATTLFHLLSLTENKVKVSKQIFSFTRNNKKIVLADAFLFQPMIEIFQSNSKVSLINEYRDDVQLEIYEQKDAFINDLIESAKIEPCTVSSGSTGIIRIIQTRLNEAGISSVVISSETSKSMKQAIYRSFENTEPIAQVILYSPTLTVGLSNENNVRLHWHFDSGLSMDVLSSLQMIKRTRNADRIKMYLGERVGYAPTNLLQIQSQLSEFQDQDEDGDDIGINSTGVYYSKILQLRNILENRHKFSFMELLKLQFKNEPTWNNTKIKPFVAKLAKEVKKEDQKFQLEVFKNYLTLEPEKIAEIESSFATTKEEHLIKEFEMNRSQLQLPEFFQEIQKEEIKQPGFIEKLKNFEFFKDRYKYVYTIKEYKKFKASKIELRDLGFIRQRNLYVLHPIIKKVHGI